MVVSVFALGAGGCIDDRDAHADRVLDFYLDASPLGERIPVAMRRDSTLQHSSFQGVSGRVPRQRDGFNVYTLEGSAPPGERAPGRWERVRAARLISESAASASLAEARLRGISSVPPLEGCAGYTAKFRVLVWTFDDSSGAAVVVPVSHGRGTLNTQLIVFDQNVELTTYLSEYREEPCRSEG